ncbi:putative antibiotic biosynthesis monooxygenase [Talaromyces proteolyticus]|uniref:Antibiotic biosynthesis monooxygenase n=1 Tax=Talaromyces proteolyticus TaxID=1131652 RepID=A0AAD4Q5A7_9EURO|nr:putative antibiotic biosynthesis monooxygenase [Talaromyces proteolyticus]KAH8703835.1 putative antibiotic biosynthesis monooxygenase [Talaromyces proteolyticus]
MSDKYIHLLLEEVKKVTEAVHKAEPDVLRYYAIQTKNAQGQDQLIFVEKYGFRSICVEGQDGQLIDFSNRYATAESQKAHRSTVHFQAFAKQAQELLAAPLDVKAGALVAGYETRASL